MNQCQHCTHSAYRNETEMLCAITGEIVLRSGTCGEWMREPGIDDEGEMKC